MFKKIQLLILLVSLSFAVSATVFAATAGSDVLGGLDNTAERADLSREETDLGNILGGVINYGFGLVGVIFITVILIGGYLWMAARGNEERISKAKTFLLNGIFGLMVVFLAYGLVYIILFSLRTAIKG